MLSEDTLIGIANIFCGDTGEVYAYKSGPKLVEFFNQYFHFEDTYGQGFPSRWRYVTNKLIELSSNKKLEEFLNIILSKEYFLRDLKSDEVTAIRHSNLALEEMKRLVKKDMYNITNKNGKYFIIKENEDLVLIGTGGFANVYKQHSTGLIIKKLKDDYLGDEGICSRFRREYDITKSLSENDGIIRVYDFDKTSYSYSMEEAEMTLESYVKQNHLSEDIKIKCIQQVLNIVAEVHKRKIIHRDISPNNIFIIKGKLKMADFGLGNDLQIFSSHQTMYTHAFGQIRYCAPEQFMLLKDGDERSDVFSLGKLINFILTGQENNSHHFLRTVVEKATNHNAAFRYANAGELLRFTKKSIDYYQNQQSRTELLEKIRAGILDTDTESFIYEMNGELICQELINPSSKFSSLLLNFMKMDESHAEYVVQSIEANFREVCTSWNDYDPIGYFANGIINSSFSFPIKELAAQIARYIAFDVNRYSIQHIVARTIENGIDPLLEEMLEA